MSLPALWRRAAVVASFALLHSSPTRMSHNCSDEHDHHGHGHDHDHSHDGGESLGPQDSLYSYIDVDNVVAFNASGTVKDLFRPWDRRMSEQCIESDDEPEMLVVIHRITDGMSFKRAG
jgi:hypothetical protein